MCTAQLVKGSKVEELNGWMREVAAAEAGGAGVDGRGLQVTESKHRDNKQQKIKRNLNEINLQ